MVNVIGLGYIGLPTALMMASHGISVVGTDYNPELVSQLQNGNTTFKENGLDELFVLAQKEGILFSQSYQKTDIYIIAVPTPYDKANKKIDPHFVIDAVKEVINVCESDAIIVIESTIAPGTVSKYIRPIVEKCAPEKKIHIVHAPERIIPGNMIYELYHNNRTIGADDRRIGERVKKIYQSFCQGEITITDIETAEMTKVIENTFRAVNIAFANELALLCRQEGLNVYEIIRICNQHPRVNILNPGPGVGGHCISVDPWFLVGEYPLLAKLTGQAMDINSRMPEFVLNRIYSIMQEKGITSISRVGLYGLTYKENVDDLRESPTLQLLESHANHLGSGLKVYDPYIHTRVTRNQYYDLESFMQDIDFVVIMVKHDEILSCQEILKDKIVLDCQNVIHNDDVYKL